MEQTMIPVTANMPAETNMPVSDTTALIMAAQQRAIVEARYKMALARPRDLDLVRERMLKDAQRPSFAAVAIYHKPVGNGVEGASIRFVEAALRNMTNILTETMTISDEEDKRVMRISCSDLETNTYYSQDVTVTKTVERRSLPAGEKPLRIRTNSYGKPVYILRATDDEILNKQNALISKAVRTLGLRIIPGDLVDEALAYVHKTIQAQDAQNPDAAKNNLVDAFNSLGVKVLDLKDYIGHELDTLNPAELQNLRELYTTIRDGETTWKAVIANKRETEDKAKIKKQPPLAKEIKPKIEESVPQIENVGDDMFG